MYRYLWLIAALFLVYSSLSAQRLTTPKPEKVSLARAIKAQYGDVKIAATNIQQQVRFFVDKKTQKAGATIKSIKNLIAVQGDYNHVVAEFFDETSEVKNIVIKNSKGKRQAVSPRESLYEQDGIFHSDAKVTYFPLQFDLQGSSYQVGIEKIHQDIRYFPSLYFSEGFPIENITVEFIIPRDLEIELVEKNFAGFEINKTQKFEADINADVITYTGKKFPPTKNEYSTKGPSHLYPHLLILPKSFQVNGQKKVLFQETKDLYKWYRSLVLSMNNDDKVIANLAQELTKNVTTDIEKIKAIYYWVQDNIRYIAFEDGIAGFKPDESQNVLEKKYGDCKGMANLNKQLLKAAGFDARLTWIGTKRLSYDYSTPCLAVDNHMICTVILDDKKYYLDATEEFNEWGTYAERIQGRQVLIEDGENYILETVPNTEYLKNTRHFQQNLSLEEDKLVGNGQITFQGESKANFLYELHNLGKSYEKDALRYYVNDGNKSYKINQITTTDISDRDADMKIDFILVWENVVARFGNDIYLHLDTEKLYDQAKFEDDRTQDYLFTHKSHLTTQTILKIPDNYSITYLPEPLIIEEDAFIFKVAYTQEGDLLTYNKTLAFPKAEITKKDFSKWNKAIAALNAIHQEQVVLTRQ